MKNKTKLIIGIIVLFVLIIVFFSYWIIYLNIAHSTFENYYKFRGCIQLLNKTDDYGYCKIRSGETIKIVKFQDKWYLDGDLPVKCFWFIDCP